MSWARLDDAILDNAKIIAAGPLGFLLHVAAITWCARNLTDGFIPKRKIATLIGFEGHDLFVLPDHAGRGDFPVTAEDYVSPCGDDVATQLKTIGLWHDRGEFWEIHDYLTYNPSRAEVLRKRERERSKKARRKPSPGESPGEQNGNPQGKDVSSPGESVGILRHPVPVPVPGSRSRRSRSKSTMGADAPGLVGFAQFYDAFPKKRHRPAAERAWRSVDGATRFDAIMAGLERWQGSAQWASGRIEDPSTFLNQRQWDDDPTPAANQGDSLAAMVAEVQRRRSERA